MNDYTDTQKTHKTGLTQADKFKKKNDIGTGFSGIKMENSSKDCVQLSNQLEFALIEQKKENKRLLDEIENRKERFLKREVEYRKIMEDLKNEIKNKAVPENTENKKLDEAKEYHKLIQENIDNIQLKTSKIILDQEKDILRFFNNKITEIKKQFEEERIKKGKKDQDYVEKELKLTSKLEWIKNIAQKIDNENHNLMKKYMDLKAQFQTQENDREMLLKELIMKKKKNAILKSQLEQYEQLLNEATGDVDDDDDMRKTTSSKKFKQFQDKTISANKNHQQSRYSNIYQSNLHAFEYNSMNPIKIERILLQRLKYKMKYNTLIQLYIFRYSNSLIIKLIYKQLLGENKGKSEVTYDYNYLYKQGTGYYTKQEQLIRSEKTLRTLQNTLKKEQRRARELKLMYLKEIESKSELEMIIKKNVEKIKKDYQSKSQNKLTSSIQQKSKGDSKDQFSKEMRELLIDYILNDDKVLTLVYDKTFYPDIKNLQIDENNEEYSETEN